MQELTSPVGEGGTNTVHDSALVQAILCACKRPLYFDPTRSSYLSAVDGSFGSGSKAALRLFQLENVFVDMKQQMSVNNPNATLGIVKPGDATWKAMLQFINPAFSGLRVPRNTKVPYLEADQAQLAGCIARAQGANLAPNFTPKIVNLINEMYKQTGISLNICDEGARRTFQKQYEILLRPGNKTKAGPGESNHNYGQAADIGFKNLRWIKPDGSIEMHEDWWLRKLDPKEQGTDKAMVFWNKMRSVGASFGLLPSNKPGDYVHLQAWSDNAVSMVRSLAALLTSVSGMKWQYAGGGYQCDFGLGKQFYPVGSAAQIWSKTGQISQAALTANGFTGANANASATQKLRDKLRAAFDSAETNWASWQPK